MHAGEDCLAIKRGPTRFTFLYNYALKCYAVPCKLHIELRQPLAQRSPARPSAEASTHQWFDLTTYLTRTYSVEPLHESVRLDPHVLEELLRCLVVALAAERRHPLGLHTLQALVRAPRLLWGFV